MSHIGIQGLKWFRGSNHGIAIRHSLNHSNARCISQLWAVTSCLCAHKSAQIRRWSLVTSPSLFPHLPTLTCTCLEKYLTNQLRIVKIIQHPPVFKCPQKICNRCLPVPGSISPLFQLVWCLDNGPILLLQRPSFLYFLPLVERSEDGLHHPLANCFKVTSVCFRLIGSLPCALPKSDKLSLLSSAS